MTNWDGTPLGGEEGLDRSMNGIMLFGSFLTGGLSTEMNAGKNIVNSVVKQDNKLLKFARETFEGNDLLRKEANGLIEQLKNGNMNPGIGSKNIGKNIFEARSRGGARVYFRNSSNGVDIVGYSN